MGFFDKIFDKMGIGDSYDEEKEELMEKRFQSMNTRTSSTQKRSDNVFAFQPPKTERESSESTSLLNMRVVVVEPKTFDDSQQIANYLKERKPVVVNFENTDSDVAMRIVDFISGTTYALSGEIKKVSHHVFLCAPHNVNVAYSQDNRAIQTDMPWLKK